MSTNISELKKIAGVIGACLVDSETVCAVCAPLISGLRGGVSDGAEARS